MRRPFAFLLLFCALAFDARAGEPEDCRGQDLTHVEGLADAEAKRAADLMNAEGLLWRVEKPGLKPSYLFGTIHSTDASALEIARRAGEHIEGAKVVATELGGPMGALERANISAAMLAKALDRDHDTLENSVAAADRETIEKFLASEGYPSEFAHHLKLWFLALITAIPPCEAKRQALGLPEVDEFLAQSAKEQGVTVIGLETPQEQLDVIASLGPEVAAPLLALAARNPGADEDIYATMLALYRESRPAEILPISDVVGGLSPTERAAQDDFMRIVLQGRNTVMAERVAPLLSAGGAFIAVGALHLSGRDGLIERIRAAGYQVTKVW